MLAEALRNPLSYTLNGLFLSSLKRESLTEVCEGLELARVSGPFN